MKADRGDAPLRATWRANRKQSHKPLIVALVMVVGVGATALMAKNLTWQVDRLANAALPTVNNPQKIEVPSISAAEIKQGAEAAKDVYLEQVNNMLGIGTERALCATFKNGEGGLAGAIRQQNCKPNPVAEIEWSGPRPTGEERQTVFTDANYTPQTSVNTIRMPQPPRQSTRPEPQQPYVTVVKETRDSCGFARPGSLECRRARAQIYKNHSRACLQSGDSQSISCRLAKSYEPTR